MRGLIVPIPLQYRCYLHCQNRGLKQPKKNKWQRKYLTWAFMGNGSVFTTAIEEWMEQGKWEQKSTLYPYQVYLVMLYFSFFLSYFCEIYNLQLIRVLCMWSDILIRFTCERTICMVYMIGPTNQWLSKLYFVCLCFSFSFCPYFMAIDTWKEWKLGGQVLVWWPLVFTKRWMVKEWIDGTAK